MISVKSIEQKTMTEEKKREAKKDIFAFYVGRPLSYILTIPFLKTKMTPNQISILSIVPLIIGTALVTISSNQFVLLLSWLCFFLWNLLDGVDGNVARFKGITSPMGSVIDAMAGYAAMYLSFLTMGIIASDYSQTLFFTQKAYLILGSLSGVFVLFPRLIMHKAINTVGNKNSERYKGRKNFGVIEMIALNVTSITGFAQLFMLIAILLKLSDLFTLVYFLINLLVMVISIKKIVK
jgi:hypothetical protein